MKLIGKFLGTSDAQGIPAPYCRCEVCTNARQKGGREVRLRSSFLLSDGIAIDIGADAVAQSMRFGALCDVNHVLVTHTHDDHLNAHMIMEAMWGKDYRDTIHYYFTDKAFDIVEHWRASPWILKGKLNEYEENGYVCFHKLSFGETYDIGGVRVTAFEGRHRGNVDENSALYLIELENGKTLFYGLDSGPYLDSTVEALKSRRIDIFISECTAGLRPPKFKQNHMYIKDVRELVTRLYNQGTLTDASMVYLTHINHNSSYEQMVNCVKNHPFEIPVTVAYDGLEIF